MNPLGSMLDAEVEKRLETQSDSEKTLVIKRLLLLLTQQTVDCLFPYMHECWILSNDTSFDNVGVL